jgi:hypothetical protein
VGPIPLIDRVLSWSSYLTAEEKLHFKVMNIDFIMMDYYWTREFRGFVEGLVEDAPSLIFLVGLQGSGKTSALKAIESYVSGKYGCLYFRLGEDFRRLGDNAMDCRFLLVDLPDYGVGGGRRMSRDLDEVGKIWYEGRYGRKYQRRSLVVAVQKELFRGHYLLGKGEVFELRPLTIWELVIFYTKKFQTFEPFDEESLKLVGLLSRGVFRRFMRYVRLCVLDMKDGGGVGVRVDDVRRVIGPEVLSWDLDLELSGFLRGSEKGIAVEALSTLMSEGEMNQKELAAKLGSTQSSLGRLLQKLEMRSYVARERGERKELRVSIKN